MNRNEARHLEVTLTKSVVRRISGFFFKEENVSGIDPRTPIGEIARHALLHWDRVNAKEFLLRDLISCLEEKNKRLESKLFIKTANCEHYEKQARLFISKCIELEELLLKGKYKRCLVMAKWCNSEMNYWYDRIEMEQCPRFKFYEKWHMRWLELADKFKEKRDENKQRE